MVMDGLVSCLGFMLPSCDIVSRFKSPDVAFGRFEELSLRSGEIPYDWLDAFEKLVGELDFWLDGIPGAGIVLPWSGI